MTSISIIDSKGFVVFDYDCNGIADGPSNNDELVRGAESIVLKDKRGRVMSDRPSRYWNGAKSVANESGFDVLIEGVSGVIASKYQGWSVDSDGRMKQTGRWVDAETLLREGYEDLFGMDLNGDGKTGSQLLMQGEIFI